MSGRHGAIFRLILALGAGLVVIGLAWGLALAGLALCHTPALPGDEGWFRLYLMREAAGLVVGLEHLDCATADGAGLRSVAPSLAMVGGIGPVLALIWEIVGWPLRLAGLRWRGGHAVLAGSEPDMTRLSAGYARIWLDAGDRGPQTATRPYRHILPFPVPAAMSRSAARLGLGRAALVVAATSDDLSNLRLARTALACGFAGKLVVKLEDAGLRSLATDALRDTAGKARLLIAAPAVVQEREALRLAIPGRFLVETAGLPGPVHIALCGDGGGLVSMAQRIARQGYGLERAIPRLSVLTVGGSSAGVTAALSSIADVIHGEVTEIPALDTGRIDTALVKIALSAPPLSAILSLSDVPGMAVLLAERWGSVLAELGLGRPLIVALDRQGMEPDCGPIRVVGRPGLAQIEAREERLDLRARAVHAHYLDLAGTSGAEGLPALRPWADLPERYREENRAVADHIDYKLALAGIVGGARERAGPCEFAEDEVDRLARAEHARWYAARRTAGWTLGPRDEASLTHPDLVPYDLLSAKAQAKDRVQVEHLPDLLAKGGESMRRYWPVRAGGEDLKPDLLADRLVTRLVDLARTNAGHLPLLRVALTRQDLELARLVLERNLPIELVQSGADERALLPEEADFLLSRADRIRVVADPARWIDETPAVLSSIGEPCDILPA